MQFGLDEWWILLRTPDMDRYGMGHTHHCTLFSVSQRLLPSLKLTWPLKIDPWKRRFLLETTIFRCFVTFREGKTIVTIFGFELPT